MRAVNTCPACKLDRPIERTFVLCTACGAFVCTSCDAVEVTHSFGRTAHVCVTCKRVAKRDRVSIAIAWDERGTPRIADATRDTFVMAC